ncbi:hypothetical protein H9L17_00025 [Thermomonas brevis]|uniref:Uncharacterized protein n=1 Tax=Thermomonas brevis TaxID=215691 RepID=A0A7G9QTE5_9GAMM|nr:hypothetical protein [Thermomonas brevis]QNN46620.1 hypothetical protein H9L17_00025 [Thermomonas brevis]
MMPLKLAVTAFWGIAAVAAFATTVPRPWWFAFAGIVLGCMAGRLRSRAIAAGTGARTANVLGWLCGVGLLVLAMAFAEDMFLGAWAAGFAGHLFADGLCSLPAARRKVRQAPASA